MRWDGLFLRKKVHCHGHASTTCKFQQSLMYVYGVPIAVPPPTL